MVGREGQGPGLSRAFASVLGGAAPPCSAGLRENQEVLPEVKGEGFLGGFQILLEALLSKGKLLVAKQPLAALRSVSTWKPTNSPPEVKSRPELAFRSLWCPSSGGQGPSSVISGPGSEGPRRSWSLGGGGPLCWWCSVSSPRTAPRISPGGKLSEVP